MVLLFCPVLSLPFYILYLLAGFTDVIDGIVARKTNTASEFGAKLDTVADFIFVIVCLIKLLPVLDIHMWIYVWIVVIAVIKVLNVVCGYAVQKKFVVAHTIMNKVTGVLLFMLPLTVSFVDVKYSSVIVCVVATVAAVQEGYSIRIR